MHDDDLLLELLDECIVAQAAHGYESSQAAKGANFEFKDTLLPLSKLPRITHDPGDPLTSMQFGGGRTVDLGNKESARISLHFNLVCPRSKRDEVYEWGDTLYDLMLAREVQGLQAGKNAKMAISEFCEKYYDPHPAVVRMGMHVEYGLTLNLGGYQFAKPTVGRHDSFAPAEFQTAWTNISAWLQPRIKAAVKKARNPKSSTDLGL